METAKKFEAKLARIYQAINSDKPSVLARLLEIKAPSVAAACKRQQIPGGWVETVAEKCGVSADWLFFGIGEMRPGTVQTVQGPVQETAESTPTDSGCSKCLKLYATLDTSRQETIVAVKEISELKEKIGMLEVELERLKNAQPAEDSKTPLARAH